jgi:AAA domain
MGGFRKAKPEQAALKVGLYGPPGSGKTFTSLLMAEGLARLDGKRIAYVDTEHGTDFYSSAVPSRAAHPEAFEFDALYTRSIMEVLAAVKQLNPQEYSVIVIDSITHLWEAARNAYEGKQTRAGTIPMHAWGAIKKPYKELLSMLLSSPMHAFICGRQGTEYATDDDTDELKAVGVKMKAEGETAYEPHILIRMEAIKPRKTHELATIVAYAEKDRTGVLSGRSFRSPTFESLCTPLLGLLGRKQASIKSTEETATEDAEAMEAANNETAARSGKMMRTFCAWIDLCQNADALTEIGKKITPEVKTKMLPAHLAAVREKYHRRMSAYGNSETGAVSSPAPQAATQAAEYGAGD